jgi:hypothetical protein
LEAEEEEQMTLNEAKTRMVNIHQTGINFLGFNLTWRKSRRGCGYLHAQPSQKSRRSLREKLEDILMPAFAWKLPPPFPSSLNYDATSHFGTASWRGTCLCYRRLQ